MASTSSAKRSSAMKKFPDWLEMPHELMVNILQRLRTIEILKTRKVCTTWRRICKDPALWKVINVHRFLDDKDYDFRRLEKLTKQAVDLSCGELTDITISAFGDDDLLDYIVQRSSKLKRLDLRECTICVMGSGLARAVKNVPGLEELYLRNTLIDAKDIEVIGQNCPQLKSFKMCKWSELSINCDDYALAIENNMPELRHLELLDREMTNDGLKAILNGCPHLETLDVHGCYSLSLGGKFGQLCKERIKDFQCDPPVDMDNLLRYYVDGYYEYEDYDNYHEY